VADLAAAGWQVSGQDPAPVRTPPGVLRASAVAAAAGSDLVIGLTGPAEAVAAAEAAGSSYARGRPLCRPQFGAGSG
jgi:hypothetical protein